MSEQADEFAAAREKQPKPRLKAVFFKRDSDEEFLSVARAELPFLWGRLNLLEEFYAECSPGFTERARRLHDQIGAPKAYRRGILRYIWDVLTK